jgi:hypothetical protein
MMAPHHYSQNIKQYDSELSYYLATWMLESQMWKEKWKEQYIARAATPAQLRNYRLKMEEGKGRMEDLVDENKALRVRLEQFRDNERRLRRRENELVVELQGLKAGRKKEEYRILMTDLEE